MATILPNNRVGNDFRAVISLADSGVKVDWSSLEYLRVFMVSEAQGYAFAGKCKKYIDADDPTLLHIEWDGGDQMFYGIHRVVVQCALEGMDKTYDKRAVNVVALSDSAPVVHDDDETAIEITVEEYDTSILAAILAACEEATRRAAESIASMEYLEDSVSAAETTRAMAEAGRVSAEMSRNAAETARRAAETERAKKWPDVLRKHNLGIVRTHEEAVALMDSITESGVFFILNDDENVSYEIHSFVNEEFPDHRIQLYTMSDDGGSLYLRYYMGDGAWGEKAFADTDDLDDYMRLSGNQSVSGRKTFEDDVEMHYLELETGNFDLDNIYEHSSGDSLKELFDAKQGAIADLDDIRTGAGKGATALQPSDVEAVAKSGSYNDLTDKPSIPDVSGKADKSYVDTELAKKNVKIKAGENVTITDNADGTQTISAQGGGGGSTPVVDSLDSDSATSALSARQGKVLKGLVDGKQAFLPVTYAELKALRDAGGLTAGMQYRITDYECTTIQEDTRSAGHRFDIVVVADSTDTLNENARAMMHDGDTYFATANLAAWELKYNLDNDNERFAWADENGKGVICWMKDEWNNECPYDFKNIQFKRTINLNNGLPVFDKNAPEMWVYTFTATSQNVTTEEWSGLKDGSLESPYGHESDENSSTFHDNVIKPYFMYYDTESEDYTLCGKIYLNDIVLLGSFEETESGNPDDYPYYVAYCCYGITFGNGCHNITFGHGCYGITFGYGCYNITFGHNCYGNTFGESCYNITFGSSCYNNTFGSSCFSNTFGNGCNSNTFGENCYKNTFGNSCYGNTFGNYCYNNTFGSSPSAKINYCKNISLGDGVHDNKISGTTTPTSSKCLQNIRIAQGVIGQTILVATGLAYETYVGFGSNGALVMKNNLDQYTKPSAGIPSTDLAQSVRDTLAKVEEIYQDYIDANNLI